MVSGVAESSTRQWEMRRSGKASQWVTNRVSYSNQYSACQLVQEFAACALCRYLVGTQLSRTILVGITEPYKAESRRMTARFSSFLKS